MSRYHVNPQTLKTGLCRAKTPESCDFYDGENHVPAPHFGTQKDADAYVQDSLADQEVTTISKSPSDETTTDNSDTIDDWASFLMDADAEQEKEDAKKQEEEEEQERRAAEKARADAEYNDVSNHMGHDENREGGTLYEVYQESEKYALQLINKANKRLERSGFEGKFDYTIERFVKEERKDGFTQYYELTSIMVYPPEVEHNGYKFLAAVSSEEGGLVVRSPRNSSEDLKGWRPDSTYCEHCGSRRKRKRTYLIKSPDGEVRQIGSSCVKGYLGGTSPAGLWSMNYDVIDQEKVDRDPEYTKSNSMRYKSEEYVAVALAVSHNGEKYRSRKSSEEYGGFSTSDITQQVLAGNHSIIGKEEYDRISKEYTSYLKNGRAREVIESAKKLDQSTDYGKNMSVIANSEHITPRSSGFLASAIAVDNRQKREREEKNAIASGKPLPDKGEKVTGIPYLPGFMGNKDDQLKNKKFKIVSNQVHTKAGYSYYDDSIEYSILKLRDEDGHDATVFANRVFDEQEGDELEVSSARVKDHNVFKGKESTILKNMRIKKKK